MKIRTNFFLWKYFFEVHLSQHDHYSPQPLAQRKWCRRFPPQHPHQRESRPFQPEHLVHLKKKINVDFLKEFNNQQHCYIKIYFKLEWHGNRFSVCWQAGFSFHNFYCYSAYVLHPLVLELPVNSNYNYTKFTINLCMVLWERLYGLYHLLWCIDVFWRVLCFHPLPLPCLLGLWMAPDNIWNINWHMSFFYRLVTTKFVRSLF